MTHRLTLRKWRYQQKRRKCQLGAPEVSESVFSDSSPPPTILGMGNNDFENKHPRAKDGKFTEKLRKEADLTLELGDQLFTPPSTPRLYERGEIVVGKEIKREDRAYGKVSIKYECPESGDIAPGEWRVKQVLEKGDGAKDITYCCSEGKIAECYRPDGSLEYRFDTGRDDCGKVNMVWDEEGTLREVARSYTRDEIVREISKSGEYLEHVLYDDIGKPIEKAVIIGRGLDADGNVKLARIEYSYDEEDADGNEMHTAEVTEL